MTAACIVHVLYMKVPLVLCIFRTGKDKGKQPLNAPSSKKMKIVRSEQVKSAENHTTAVASSMCGVQEPQAQQSDMIEQRKSEEHEGGVGECGRKLEEERRRREEEEKKEEEKQRMERQKEMEEQRKKEREKKQQRKRKKLEMRVAELEGKIRSCRYM